MFRKLGNVNNKFELKILNKISPFVETSLIKDKEIRVFVGREPEKSTLMTSVQTVALSKRGSALKITGPGGSGKSTLFGYIAQIIDNGKIFKESDQILDESKLELLAAFIDAPKDQDTSFRYFWTSIVDSFSDSVHGLTAEFFEYFAITLILTCLKKLVNTREKAAIVSVMEGLYPRFSDDIRTHEWDDIVRIEKLIESGSIYENFNPGVARNIIERNIRRLRRITVDLPDGASCRFSYEKEYFDKLFDLLDDDVMKPIEALDCLKGTDRDFLPTDASIMRLLNWVCDMWEWIHEKAVCIVVGVDNLGYLTANADDAGDTYNKFVQTLIQMRNELNNFLFVIIGTDSDWEEVERFVQLRQDYKRQLTGFFSRKIDLNRLTRDEAVEALRIIMQNFWMENKLSPSSIYFPFSAGFFSYLYDYELRDYRSMLNALTGIWNWFKERREVKTFKEPFDFIRFIRKTWAKRNGRPASLTLQDLMPFEKEVLRKRWDNINAAFKSNKKSKMVEEALTGFIEVLRDNEVPRRIALVQQNPPLQFFQDGKRQTRYPDVYVDIQNPGPLDETRKFEIQVKIHQPNQYVKLKEIKGSLEILAHRKIDALVFLMTGPGLDQSALNEIKRRNLEERVFCGSPLNADQFDALLLMVYYQELMDENPSPALVKEVFSTVFGMDWSHLITVIGNMMSMTPIAETALGSSATPSSEPGTLSDFMSASARSARKTAAAGTADTQDDVVPPFLINESGGHTARIESDGLDQSIANENSPEAAVVNETTAADCSKGNDAPIPMTKDKELKGSGSGEVQRDVPAGILEMKNRYECVLDEVSFIMNLALDRTGRWGGQVTKDYVKKRVPPELKEEQCRLVFDQLRKDSKKYDAILAEYKGTSLKFNDVAVKFRAYLEKQGDHE
mgnify:CR=1 FL=1